MNRSLVRPAGIASFYSEYTQSGTSVILIGSDLRTISVGALWSGGVGVGEVSGGVLGDRENLLYEEGRLWEPREYLPRFGQAYRGTDRTVGTEGREEGRILGVTGAISGAEATDLTSIGTP